ncbi:MAG: TSUP family transporter, partial [Acidobacteria bacterium]|nr:TSUP family transporter [Acidobacteriota bacterium]
MTVLTFVGSTLQGAIGFGMGLLAAPLLILLDPRFVPAPILACTLVLTLLMAYRERHAIDLRGIKWAMLGRVAGTVVAGGILAIVAADTLVLLFGILILAAVAMSVSGLRFAPTGRALVAAGVLSGVLGTVAAVGGPPLA